MRFSVDSYVLAKEKKKLNGYLFGIIGFAIGAVVMVFTLFSDEVQAMMDEADAYRRYADLFRGYDSYYDEMISNASQLELVFLFYLLMALVFTIMLIVYICKYVKKKPLVKNYEKSYLQINGDTITGVAFREINKEGYSFSVDVSELKYVSSHASSPFNLVLETQSKRYSCLGIERASEIARKLKQRMTELKENSAENV